MADLEKYINDYFEKNRNPNLVYHNLSHTQAVVSRAREISKRYLLNEKDAFIVECASWFHDVGYLMKNDPLGHERTGADFAEVFLSDDLMEREVINAVRGCIMATVLPQKPETILEQIVCDADLFHFGTPDLFLQDALMHQEVELRIKQPINHQKWLAGTIRLLESHSYHTDYCQILLNRQKHLNLDQLKSELGK